MWEELKVFYVFSRVKFWLFRKFGGLPKCIYSHEFSCFLLEMCIAIDQKLSMSRNFDYVSGDNWSVLDYLLVTLCN